MYHGSLGDASFWQCLWAVGQDLSGLVGPRAGSAAPGCTLPVIVGRLSSPHRRLGRSLSVGSTAASGGGSSRPSFSRCRGARYSGGCGSVRGAARLPYSTASRLDTAEKPRARFMAAFLHDRSDRFSLVQFGPLRDIGGSRWHSADCRGANSGLLRRRGQSSAGVPGTLPTNVKRGGQYVAMGSLFRCWDVGGRYYRAGIGATVALRIDGDDQFHGRSRWLLRPHGAC